MTTEDHQEEEQEIQHYPGVSDRIKAAIGDSVVLIIMLFIASYLFAQFENAPNQAKMVAFLLIFVLYDPLLTTFFGGTIGHHLNGICVKRQDNPEKNIPFHLAIIRYILKTTLGWISLFTVSSDEFGRAIHDHAAQSIVIYKA